MTVPEYMKLAESAISSVRIRKAMPEEYELHEAIRAALQAHDIEAIHEFRLGPRRRVDLMLPASGVAIEIKKKRVPAKTLKEQVSKYLASDLVQGLILIAPQNMYLPQRINDKPVSTISLNRLWGVALP